MDLRVMRAVDLLMDAGRLIDVATLPGEVILHTAGGSEVVLIDLGGLMMVLKTFKLGIERATVETVIAEPRGLDHTIKELIRLENEYES